jgi:hypothetical protein
MHNDVNTAFGGPVKRLVVDACRESRDSGTWLMADAKYVRGG